MPDHKTIMRAFKIFEISAVDSPAQKGARMTIMKRSDDVTKPLVDGKEPKGKDKKKSKKFDVKAVISPGDISEVRGVVDEIYIDEKIKDYIVDIVCATREPEKYGIELGNFISYGASPRATIYLTIAAKAYAFIQGRGYVTPQDVKSIGMDVLRHRVIVSYEAEAEEKTSEDVVQTIFDNIEVP